MQDHSEELKKLCKVLGSISNHYHILIVPGGGRFADAVRDLQHVCGFSDERAHQMALLAMEMYGLMLHDLIGISVVSNELRSAGKCTIFLPYKVLKDSKDLEHSWAVTSDSIAAWAAVKLDCKKLVLVKAVDGIFKDNKLLRSLSAGELAGIRQSCVDPFLPQILRRWKGTCWIVNGRHPERIEKIMKGRKPVGTVILPSG